MVELPNSIVSAEPARLFPILSERSVEGRTVSIFLATLTRVRPFAERLLGQIGRKVGAMTKLEAWTEASFVSLDEGSSDRPDGLLIIDTGRTRWVALVEAKVRKSEIEPEQLNRYLKIAKANKFDAVITLSNQFSLAPHHHPLAVNTPKQIELFHFSWMRVLTEAYLLLNEGVEDVEQEYILREFKRFISHESAGVESFTQMPSVWPEIVDAVQAGGNILVKPGKEVAQAWNQECQDLSLIFSRQIDAGVKQKLTRAQIADPTVRIGQDFEELRDKQTLSVELLVPDAADSVKVCADFSRRSISISMYLAAPADKKSNSARLNWLLRQLPKENCGGLHVRAQWPATSPWTQIPLREAIENGEALFADKGDMVLLGFEIVSVVDLGARFGQRQTFIKELESAIPDFWERVGQNLQAWVKPAPRVKEERSEPDAVSRVAISGSD